MRFEFHPDALREYDEAAHYYASCRPRLEVRFMAAVEETIARVVQAPERWPVIEGAVRRCLTRVFPYVVLYTIEPDYLLIVAVMHSHREPGYWHGRMPG